MKIWGIENSDFKIDRMKINELYVKNFFINDSMWDISIDDDIITIISKSKAKKKKTNKFVRPIEEGSYFFYNSTTNWYWYFRPRTMQDLLDRFSIDRMIPAEGDIELEIYAIKDENDKIIPSDFDLIPTLKYWSPNEVETNVKFNAIIPEYKSMIDVLKGNNGVNLCVGNIKISFKDWIIIENRVGHRELYVKKNVKVSDLKLNEYEEVEFVYPREVGNNV
jgi:hypothetical protein